MNALIRGKRGSLLRLSIFLGALLASACTGDILGGESGDGPGGQDPGDSDPGGDTPDPGGGDPLPGDSVAVQLIPNGATGVQRVNLAVPLPAGALADDSRLQVVDGDTVLPAYRRGLAQHSDGTWRAVQVQVDVDVDTVTSLEIVLVDEAQTDAVAPVAVSETLNGSDEPLVWARLPAEWLSASGVTGPALPMSAAGGTSLDGAWSQVCNYDRFNTESFRGQMGERGPWLYDRATTIYRGYAMSGSSSTMMDAYREAHIYFGSISGTGSNTRIGVPTAEGDLKYHYTQGMAIHYLLTGDDRFRERAEDVAQRASELWSDPGYDGGSDFWTERHAGFSLLAYVWAAMVSDDRAAEFIALADDAVAAYRAMQTTYPSGYDSTSARCFAHTAQAHDEPFGFWGCSPWMSGILADALDCYVRLRAGDPVADDARDGIIQLGRAIAEQGLDGEGKPYYFMGIGNGEGAVDDYEEHWGEPAYVVAMAWYWDGGADSSLKETADDLVAGLASRGEAAHIRSFNWQCRSAPTASWFLLP